MDTLDNPTLLIQFLGLIGLGGVVAVVWAAGFVVFGVRQLRDEMNQIWQVKKEYDKHVRAFEVLQDRVAEHIRHCAKADDRRDDVERKQIQIENRVANLETTRTGK